MAVPALIDYLRRTYGAGTNLADGTWRIHIDESQLTEPAPAPIRPDRRWSERSLKSLDGIHPNMRRIADAALQTSEVDFLVIAGMRSEEEQRRLVASGASQTMNSRHLIGAAVDVVAWADGAISWAGSHYPPIADAFIGAARDLAIPMRWGGAWQVSDVTKGDAGADDMMAAYVALRRGEGRRPFLDLGHFELAAGTF